MIDTCAHGLCPEIGLPHSCSVPLLRELLVCSVPECVGRTGLRAPGLQILGSAIVTKVALLHESCAEINLGHTERAGIHTIPAGDTTRCVGLLNYALWSNHDRQHGADLCAGGHRRFTMHADGGLCRYAEPPVDEIDHNHALALMGVALPAGDLTSAASDAAGWIDE